MHESLIWHNIMIKAKFRCNSVTLRENSQEVLLNAVYGADGTDNGQWSKWTPQGELKMTITNEQAFDKLVVGKEYYINLEEAE